MVSSLQTFPMVNSITFNRDQSVSVNFSPGILNDLFKFCVLGNAILRVDTTFELVDGLWLTDTRHTNETLIDLKGKHPELPGPSDWHFRKTRESYRRFAGETIIQKPERCSTKWNRWSPERQRRHINCFCEFVPESYDSYKQPSSAGHKTSPRSHKRRAEQPEPEIFVERLPDADPPAKKTAVSPLRLSKGSRSSQWQVRLTYKVYDYSSFYYCALQSSTI